MAVYRSDQAQLTFGFEPTPGGYAELASNATVHSTTGNGVINNTGGYPSGVTSITVTQATGTWTAGQDIRIGPKVGGTGADGESEIRRILYVDSLVLYLDVPTAFAHPNGVDVDRVSIASTVQNDMYITQVPGVYDTVDVPDPDMTIEPRYFLGTVNKRNYAIALKGQQTYAGSVAGIVLLDGKPLRFPFGKIVTHTAGSAPGAIAFSPSLTINQASGTAKGDVFVPLDQASGTLAIAANELLVFDYIATAQSTSKMEIRKVVSGAVSSGTTTIVQLDKPLQFAHDDNGAVRKISGAAVYTHHIYETVDLDTVSWHLHMKDSAENVANNFDRRYYGGLIGSASIAADEGGMVSMSWDGVNFQGMKHNQLNTSSSTDVPHAGLMTTIDSNDVAFPTNQPYFFSQGSVTMFGQEIARIRSFNITVSNGEEPRYYINKRLGEKRGPSEIREGRREYSMSATLALPDSQASTSTTTTLFKELLLEGRTGQAGFDIVITFTRGTDDSITLHIPGNEDVSNVQSTSAAGIGSTGAAAGLWQSGAIIRTAPHSITGDNPVQVDADIIFRNIKIEITDSEYYKP